MTKSEGAQLSVGPVGSDPAVAGPPMPTTVDELWDQCWIAEDEAEAVAQAERMYDLFAGKRVTVDRLEAWTTDGGYVDEFSFTKPWPEVWVDMLSTERGWDGDVLYAEWYVHTADPEQVVTTDDGDKFRMGDLAVNLLTTTAPGIGTLEGFGHRTGCPLVYPLTRTTVTT